MQRGQRLAIPRMETHRGATRELDPGREDSASPCPQWKHTQALHVSWTREGGQRLAMPQWKHTQALQRPETLRGARGALFVTDDVTAALSTSAVAFANASVIGNLVKVAGPRGALFTSLAERGAPGSDLPVKGPVVTALPGRAV
ncbi:hypothetical protein NDU88_000584 [Pleurodeles waltl]|uniref:Uncharacterized protein n=1 Tax=Pleurodeles waltl TaxID=8319 RepID=A0AAV7ML98_PLEWA|nr:hypothetical protein NDU88_000584 [Pleurodeles waltl]